MTEARHLVCAPAMSWAQRLLGVGSIDVAAEVRKDVAEVHRRLTMQAHRIRASAALAPNVAAESDLRALAAEDEALAAELKPHLPAGWPGRVAETDGAAGDIGPSHWARVVDVLQRHRDSQEALIAAAARLREIAPSVADLCTRLARAEEGHLERLRHLVARADPQALD